MEEGCMGFVCLSSMLAVLLAGFWVNLSNDAYNARTRRSDRSVPEDPDPHAAARRRYQQLDGLDGNFDGRIDLDRWP
jgi:hypothetical protein